MRRTAGEKPGTGACNLASAMELWLWTLEHLQKAKDANGQLLYRTQRQGVTFPLADALCWILASRSQILDVLQLERVGKDHPLLAEALPGILNFLSDLCHTQTAKTSGEVGRICAELVYGYNHHPAWNSATCESCFHSNELELLEGLIPGISGVADSYTDVLEENNKPPRKAGPCVRFEGYEEFARIRMKMDGCLTGNRLAKDRAAQALAEIMIPEALDYPI